MGISAIWLLGFMAATCLAQQSPAVETKPPAIQGSENSSYPSEYVLGPGDQVSVTIMDSEHPSDKPFLIDMSGFIRLPMAGRIHAAGLTVQELEAAISDQLKKYFVKPDVTVAIAEYGSQPVSIVGSVKTPGVHQVRGRKTLLEMISLAGGLEDSAGVVVKITRSMEWGRIPLPSATPDPSGQYTVAEINLKSLLQARNPGENILVRPHDVISVPKADVIYVIGQVFKPGAFVLTEHENVTVLQALSMASGLDRMANEKDARILRLPTGSPNRIEIPINLKSIMAGTSTDVPMKPEDILFVPDSTPKRAGIRTMEAILQMTTGVVIWRR